jgi:hypothetical protein
MFHTGPTTHESNRSTTGVTTTPCSWAAKAEMGGLSENVAEYLNPSAVRE